jgi:predicted RNA-binding protein with PUA domain
MSGVKCTCGDNPRKACPVCEKRESPGYWCEICGQVVTDKRCPLCGLKTRKVK